MKGKIRTLEKCPHCDKPFSNVLHPITKDQIDLMCKEHKTRPHYFYIDARHLKAGKIYRDKRGNLFDSFLAAHRQLEDMRGEVDDRTFDPDDWMPSKLKEFKLENEAQKWLDKIEHDKSHVYVRHCKTFMEKYIIPEFGAMDVRDMRTSHIEDFYYLLRDKDLSPGKKPSPKYIKNILTTLQTFLNRLQHNETISRVPRFPVVRVPQKARGWLNRERQAQVLSFIPERHRLIFEMLVETAERPGEVCAHKRKDLIDGEIVIERAFDERGSLKETKSGASFTGVCLSPFGRSSRSTVNPCFPMHGCSSMSVESPITRRSSMTSGGRPVRRRA